MSTPMIIFLATVVLGSVLGLYLRNRMRSDAEQKKSIWSGSKKLFSKDEEKTPSADKTEKPKGDKKASFDWFSVILWVIVLAGVNVFSYKYWPIEFEYLETPLLIGMNVIVILLVLSSMTKKSAFMGLAVVAALFAIAVAVSEYNRVEDIAERNRREAENSARIAREKKVEADMPNALYLPAHDTTIYMTLSPEWSGLVYPPSENSEYKWCGDPEHPMYFSMYVNEKHVYDFGVNGESHGVDQIGKPEMFRLRQRLGTGGRFILRVRRGHAYCPPNG